MPAEKNKSLQLAVIAETLYLCNLLILPGLAFLLLLVFWWRHRGDEPGLGTSHLAQTVSASIWAGMILVVANLVIVLFGGYQSATVWVVVITYFTVCHSALVVFGAFGLSKAMAGQCWRYPLVGRPLPPECLS